MIYLFHLCHLWLNILPLSETLKVRIGACFVIVFICLNAGIFICFNRVSL
jgi:hypothetical protein